MSLAVQRHYHHYYQSRSVFDEKEILGGLNPELHMQVVTFILDGSIGRLPLFKGLSSSFHTAIFPFLKPVTFNLGDVIFEKGAESSSMLFLLAGEVRALNPLDDSHATHILRHGERAFLEPNGTEFSTRPWAGCFGQSALTGARRPATYVAHQAPCECLIIEKNDLLGIFAADAKTTARLLKSILADGLSESRIRSLVKRLWISRLERGTDDWAAALVGRAWRKRFETTALDHDEVHKLILQHTSTAKKRAKTRVGFTDGPLRFRSRASSRAASRASSRVPSRLPSPAGSPTSSRPTTPTRELRPFPAVTAPALSPASGAATIPEPPTSTLPPALPGVASSPGEWVGQTQLSELSSEVERLSDFVQLLTERITDHESTIDAKLDQILKSQLEAKVSDMWGQ